MADLGYRMSDLWQRCLLVLQPQYVSDETTIQIRKRGVWYGLVSISLLKWR